MVSRYRFPQPPSPIPRTITPPATKPPRCHGDSGLHHRPRLMTKSAARLGAQVFRRAAQHSDREHRKSATPPAPPLNPRNQLPVYYLMPWRLSVSVCVCICVWLYDNWVDLCGWIPLHHHLILRWTLTLKHRPPLASPVSVNQTHAMGGCFSPVSY